MILDAALIVDPDERHRAPLRRALLSRWREVVDVVDVRGAVEVLLENDHIGLVIIDVGAVSQGVELAGVAQLKLPTPLVIATHAGLEGADGFVLGRLGVRRLIAKPFTADEALRAIDEAVNEEPPNIVTWVAPFLGRVGLFDLETQVRKAMVLQALMSTDESRSAAARMLRAPRPVIQRAAPPRMKPSGRKDD